MFLLAKAREHQLPLQQQPITPHAVLLSSSSAREQLFPPSQSLPQSGSFHATRRSRLLFNPERLVYRSNEGCPPNSVCTQNTPSTPIGVSSTSVFSDLLHSYFHTEESPVPPQVDTPHGEAKYWWNVRGNGRWSKDWRKGKFSLPWNYPLKKEEAKEETVAPEQNSPRIAAPLPVKEEKEEVPAKKKKYFCCCCLEGDEEETPLLTIPSTPIIPPVTLRPEVSRAASVPSTPLKPGLVRDPPAAFSSRTLPTSTSQFRFSRESADLTDAREMRRSFASADEGIGSFIQGLKNSCEPVVSSRDWSLSHNDSIRSEWTGLLHKQMKGKDAYHSESPVCRLRSCSRSDWTGRRWIPRCLGCGQARSHHLSSCVLASGEHGHIRAYASTSSLPPSYPPC